MSQIDKPHAHQEALIKDVDKTADWLFVHLPHFPEHCVLLPESQLYSTSEGSCEKNSHAKYVLFGGTLV